MRMGCWLLCAWLAAGCATYTLIPADERASLERDLTGQDRDKFLRVSFYVTGFFGDPARRLLTVLPPEEVRLLDRPDSEWVSPGPIQKILPAGLRARIVKVEFATSLVVARRASETPQTQPWVYLEVSGEKKEPPLVLVLRSKLHGNDEFLAELERFLARENPAPLLAGWTEGVRDAVRAKAAVIDMPAAALEMAWGFPEVKRMSFEESVSREEWDYPGGRRKVFLAGGRVVRTEGAPP